MNVTDRQDQNKYNKFSAAVLYSSYTSNSTNQRTKMCTYCKQNHASSKCNMIPDVNSQKAIYLQK